MRSATASRGPRPRRSAGTPARPADGASGGPADRGPRRSVDDSLRSHEHVAEHAVVERLGAVDLEQPQARWCTGGRRRASSRGKPATPQRAAVADAFGEDLPCLATVALHLPGDLHHPPCSGSASGGRSRSARGWTQVAGQLHASRPRPRALAARARRDGGFITPPARNPPRRTLVEHERACAGSGVVVEGRRTRPTTREVVAELDLVLDRCSRSTPRRLR